MAMTMVWNVSANKLFESGIDRGVLYPKSGGTYPAGYAWEGLISVTEKPGGADVTDLWANNEKYAQLVAVEIFDGTIEAYTFPDEFLACLGIVPDATDPGVLFAQQARTEFALSYRSRLGSDANGPQANYKIHIIYGCLAQPSEVARSSVNDSPEAVTFSWEFKTTPVASTGHQAVSHIILDESVLSATNLAAVEAQLYGTDDPITANCPLPDALVALLV